MVEKGRLAKAFASVRLSGVVAEAKAGQRTCDESWWLSEAAQ